MLSLHKPLTTNDCRSWTLRLRRMLEVDCFPWENGECSTSRHLATNLADEGEHRTQPNAQSTRGHLAQSEPAPLANAGLTQREVISRNPERPRAGTGLAARRLSLQNTKPPRSGGHAGRNTLRSADLPHEAARIGLRPVRAEPDSGLTRGGTHVRPRGPASTGWASAPFAFGPGCLLVLLSRGQ